MITISTSTIWIIAISIIAAIGWWLAYKESEKVTTETSRLNLSLKMSEDNWKKEFESLDSKYSEERNRLILAHTDSVQKLEQDLAAALQTREEELAEAELLVKGRIEDIEKAYREVIDDQNDSLELYESYIKNFDAAITLVDHRLAELDNKGMFKSDDEIGFFFSYVNDLQSVLRKFKVDKEVIDKEQTK